MQEHYPEINVANFYIPSLLRACAESASGDLQYISTIEAIETEHIAAAYREIQTASLRNNLVLRIQAECSAILQELDSSYILKNVDIYSGGRVVSTGEKLICRHMVALLQDRGHQATYVDVSEASNVPADPAEGLNQELLSMLVEDIADKISQADGTPVITGYFGLIQGGLLQKVGRGYTDLCAALVATGLQAKELQIWKEVDGIFTADPRIVPDARLVPSITPIEARELTYYGSEVIHTSTMEQVASEGIPVRIKNVLKPYSSGTIIPPLQLEAHQSETPSALAGPVTAITTKNRIAILTAHCTSSKSSITFYQDLFLALYRWKVSVDLIATSDNNVSLAICVDTLGIDTEHQHSSSPLHDRLENLIQDIRHHGPVTIIPDMAILCIIGKDLKKNSIPSCVFNGLADENIPIEMASYGMFPGL